jgi:tetratricopeptide (TPR) repeat protein
LRAEVKTALLFGGLLTAVVVGSYLYSRSLNVGSTPRGEFTFGTGDAPELHADVEAGIAALAAEDLDRAEELLARVPPDDPSRVVALQNLGVLHWKRGDLQASFDAFLGAVALEPEQPDLYVSLSWAYFRLDRFADAERVTLLALELDPGNVQARYNVGLFRVAQGALPRAVNSYQRALRVDVARQGVERALADLLQLRELQRDRPAVHYALAYFANVLEKPALEVEHLEDYLALEPAGPAVPVARERLAAARAAAGL